MIRVVSVPTPCAGESIAVDPRCGVPRVAGTTRLRGPGRSHQHELESVGQAFIGQLPTPLCRNIVENGTVETSLLRTCTPGSACVPLALRVTCCTRRSSMATRPWLLARSVVSLCVKSARRRACLAFSSAMARSVRRSRLLYLPPRCFLPRFPDSSFSPSFQPCRPALLTLGQCLGHEPGGADSSDRNAACFTPKSTPTGGCSFGSAAIRPVWTPKLTYQCPATSLRTVAFLALYT